MPIKRRSPVIVELYYRGHRAGLYRARDVGDTGMLLEHGAIAFPDDTAVAVRLADGGPAGGIPARVVKSSPAGMRVRLQPPAGLRPSLY